jgi:hypothetical protein
MYVIGVAGQAQMGKDTLADRLCAILNERRGGDGKFWRRTAFASNVKNVISQTFGVSKEFIEEWKVKPEPPPDFDMNVRQSLQFVGDGFRKIRGTIWVDLMFREGSPKIISDVRYINEFRRVKKERGFNILVGRTDKLNDDPNGSEAMIRPYVKWCLDHFYGDFVRLEGIQDAGCPIEHMSDFDVFIRNDSTIEDLYRMVEQQLVPMVERFETSGGFLGG